MPGLIELVIVAIVLVVVLLVAVGAGKGHRRTIVLKAPPEEIYDRMYRWFALQEHEIEQEVKNQKLQVKVSGTSGVYIIVGILLLLVAVVPGILWFVLARSKIGVTLQDAPEGTYLMANLRGLGATSTWNQLVGVLSMIDAQTK